MEQKCSIFKVIYLAISNLWGIYVSAHVGTDACSSLQLIFLYFYCDELLILSFNMLNVEYSQDIFSHIFNFYGYFFNVLREKTTSAHTNNNTVYKYRLNKM